MIAAVCHPLAASPWKIVSCAAFSSRWNGCGSNFEPNLSICYLSTTIRPELNLCPATKSSRYVTVMASTSCVEGRSRFLSPTGIGS